MFVGLSAWLGLARFGFGYVLVWRGLSQAALKSFPNDPTTLFLKATTELRVATALLPLWLTMGGLQNPRGYARGALMLAPPFQLGRP